MPGISRNVTKTSPCDTVVLYLHGFLSSPSSAKARLTVEYYQKQGFGGTILVPELNWGPQQTIDRLSTLVESQPGNVVVIGSSLGGFYAGCLAERYRLMAALINPAVHPHRHWQNYIGEHKGFYSDKVQVVTEEHVHELRRLDCDKPENPANYLLLATEGDEVLDYRLAAEKYRDSQCIIEPEGNHSFDNYASYLPLIFAFFSIKN
ncbi:MAG: YqiA/YcfP family alpha/beta fold hydrolase [Pseudohongiellaceae bacterium]